MNLSDDPMLARVRLLSVQEVAALLGKRPSTIMTWTRSKRSGWPAPIRLSQDSALAWRLVDLEQFIARAMRNPPPPRTSRGGRLKTGEKRKRLRLGAARSNQVEGAADDVR